MFLRHEVAIDASFPAARERFTRFITQGWLDDASGRAHADGLVGVTRVGPVGNVLAASKLVRVRVLDPVPRDDGIVLALRWEATGAMGRLFPILDADVVLAPGDADTTRLALTGAYRVPLGGLGSSLDRLVLHRAATATIRSLLTRIADALAEPAPEPAGESAPRVVAQPSHVLIEPGAPA